MISCDNSSSTESNELNIDSTLQVIAEKEVPNEIEESNFKQKPNLDKVTDKIENESKKASKYKELNDFTDCKSIIENELKGLEFIGEIIEIENKNDSLHLAIKSLTGDKRSEITISKEGSILFKSKIEKGTLLRKDKGSLSFYEFIVKDKESGSIITHNLECNE